MRFNSLIARVVFTTLLLVSTAFSKSLVDSLLEQNDLKKLGDYINKAMVIEHDTDIPDNPRENQLLIVDNDYDVKILYEYTNGEWNEKGGEKIAQILNGGAKTTFHHLFNFKLDSEEFNSYTKDEGLVQVEILKSPYKQANLNATIQEFVQKRGIDRVINIQLQNCTSSNCDIVIFYKY